MEQAYIEKIMQILYYEEIKLLKRNFRGEKFKRAIVGIWNYYSSSCLIGKALNFQWKYKKSGEKNKPKFCKTVQVLLILYFVEELLRSN